jgi:hypothetical protein
MRELFERFGMRDFMILWVSLASIVVLIIAIYRGMPRRRNRRS